MIKTVVVGFCFFGGLILITLGQFQGSEMSPGLFKDFIDEYIKP